MTTPAAPERSRMAKRKHRTKGQPPPDEPVGRIELLAPERWIAELDAAADAMGLSRSAYIRLAVNKLMRADRREEIESTAT